MTTNTENTFTYETPKKPRSDKPRYETKKNRRDRQSRFDKERAQENALPSIDMDAPLEASGFDEFKLPHNLMRTLNFMKYMTPTPIQTQTIPAVMKGKDILGSAQTGTGKTGAFCIPIIAKMINDPHAQALIMAPTRELAAQILTVARSMIHTNPTIRTALLIGGESIGKQYAQLSQGPRLVIGTPGRINDHLRSKPQLFSKMTTVVLDEADRMLDMGFAPQIDDVLATVPAKHQTLMFSATFAPAIIKFAQKYLNDPIRIEIEPERRTAENIEHAEIHCSDSERFAHLTEELKKRDGSIIMFVKTKHGADRMAKRLTTTGHSADAIHGGLSQKQRDRAIAGFRNKKSRIMVATDVAARGLDVPHVEHVINYDLPQVAEDYVHRIGRTARAGAKGKALSLIMPADKGKWAAIQRILNPRPAGERGRDNDRRPGRANPSYNRPNARPFQKRGPDRERKPDDFSIDPASLDLAPSMERKFDRKPFGDKKPGERNYANKRPFGDKKPWGEKKEFGEKKPFGDKKPWGEKKTFGDKKPWGEKKPFDGKKPFVKKEWKADGQKVDGGKPEWKKQDGQKSGGFKKPFAKPFNKEGGKPFKKRPFTKAKAG